jgi:uncharacterized membrane protein YfcA
MLTCNKRTFRAGLVIVIILSALCIGNSAGYAGSLKDAIAKTPKGTAMNQIDSSAKPGFLGIPGAPSPNLIVAYLWAIWVGWIFSTVGAFGGIMAGVGHITILGFGDYAKGFGRGAPLNKLVTDSIRVSNQWLAGLSAIISSANYYSMGRLVAPLGMCLAIGSVGGSWLIPDLSAGKINLKDYIGYFGLIVLLLGIMLLKETTASGQAKKIKAKEAATAFERQTNREDISNQGVKIIQGSWPLMFTALGLVVASALWINLIDQLKWMAYFLAFAGWTVTFLMGEIKFSFYGVEFNFKAFIPMLGGVFIAAIASFLGIGGGFLCVPFLTSVAGLPMFLVAGTSALVVLVGMIVSIFSYMIGKGVPIAWELIGAELIGIFLGSMIGPYTSKFIPDIWLKRIFIALAFYVGLRYVTKGFLGLSIFPPF